MSSNTTTINKVPNTEFIKEKVSYDNAQADCVSRATVKGAGWTGGLASLSNRADRDAVAKEIGTLFKKGDWTKYWLGFKGVNGNENKMTAAANWTWSDGTPVPLVKADWHHNDSDKIRIQGDCGLAMSPLNHDGRLNALPCDWTAYYVCQYHFDVAAAAKETAEAGEAAANNA